MDLLTMTPEELRGRRMSLYRAIQTTKAAGLGRSERPDGVIVLAEIVATARSLEALKRMLAKVDALIAAGSGDTSNTLVRA